MSPIIKSHKHACAFNKLLKLQKIFRLVKYEYLGRINTHLITAAASTHAAPQRIAMVHKPIAGH